MRVLLFFFTSIKRPTPLLNGHYPLPRGWPLNRGSTALFSIGKEELETPRCLKPERCLNSPPTQTQWNFFCLPWLMLLSNLVLTVSSSSYLEQFFPLRVQDCGSHSQVYHSVQVVRFSWWLTGSNPAVLNFNRQRVEQIVTSESTTRRHSQKLKLGSFRFNVPCLFHLGNK